MFTCSIRSVHGLYRSLLSSCHASPFHEVDMHEGSVVHGLVRVHDVAIDLWSLLPWPCHALWLCQSLRRCLALPPPAERWSVHRGTLPLPMWEPGWSRPACRPSRPRPRCQGRPRCSRAPLPKRSGYGLKNKGAAERCSAFLHEHLRKLRCEHTCTSTHHLYPPLAVFHNKDLVRLLYHPPRGALSGSLYTLYR